MHIFLYLPYNVFFCLYMSACCGFSPLSFSLSPSRLQALLADTYPMKDTKVQENGKVYTNSSINNI